MATELPEQQGSDFPIGTSMPARRALLAAGYSRLDQLTTVSEAEIARLHGVGPKVLRLLRSALAARGQSFAAEVKGERAT